ncbi:MAG: hypothetical protein U9Q06_00350 [Nanoarchaeota archaeon]|nr:hypothetical protein [Nanoarchaeota archaeon]
MVNKDAKPKTKKEVKFDSSEKIVDEENNLRTLKTKISEAESEIDFDKLQEFLDEGGNIVEIQPSRQFVDEPIKDLEEDIEFSKKEDKSENNLSYQTEQNSEEEKTYESNGSTNPNNLNLSRKGFRGSSEIESEREFFSPQISQASSNSWEKSSSKPTNGTMFQDRGNYESGAEAEKRGAGGWENEKRKYEMKK